MNDYLLICAYGSRDILVGTMEVEAQSLTKK